MDLLFDTDAFARNGFGVVRGVISTSLLSDLRNAVQRVEEAVSVLPLHLLERLTLERDLSPKHRDGVEAAEVGDAIFIIGDPVAFDPIFWQLLHQPKIISAVQAAVGTQQLAAHFMNVTIKHPDFGRGIAWHRDYPNEYACPAASCMARVMLCLDGMSATGGATTFLPGSQLLTDTEAASHRLPKDWQAPSSDSFQLCCDPGDLVVIHPKVLHGGKGNNSGKPRRNIILQAGDANVPLKKNPENENVFGHRLS